MSASQYSKKLSRRSLSKGFTLIEMLIAVAVIAVIVGTIGPSLVKKLSESRNVKAMDTVRSFRAATAMFYQDTGSLSMQERSDLAAGYGSSYRMLSNGYTAGGATGTTPAAGWNGPYIEQMVTIKTNPAKAGYNYWGTSRYGSSGWDRNNDSAADTGYGSVSVLYFDTGTNTAYQDVVKTFIGGLENSTDNGDTLTGNITHCTIDVNGGYQHSGAKSGPDGCVLLNVF
ncbi:MAG: prepilin-type N-terminal cleavage/methylation domain-containing protein [Gammaproteobacteria bacterium]|nr:prepilin-type N-terminal cleavage/methylation domain-containing protein [Gammaproteobacteria bacterium]